MKNTWVARQRINVCWGPASGHFVPIFRGVYIMQTKYGPGGMPAGENNKDVVKNKKGGGRKHKKLQL